MINKLLFHFKNYEIQKNERNFKYRYFIKDEYNEDLFKNGYVVLKAVVNDSTLHHLDETFDTLTKMHEFKITDKFQNSGRFESVEIRKFVMEELQKFSTNFLPNVFNTDIFDHDTTGAFQIKPPGKNSDLNPHQDSPVIDEEEYNALFVWIPLCDINNKNGAISILPKSHLWGNNQRSLNVPWCFEKHIKTLKRYMHPVYVNRGDIICWDTATIHASESNLGNKNRIAITTTLLPKNYQLIEYYYDNQEPKHIEKYQVSKKYWQEENILSRPSCPPNILLKKEPLKFPLNISKKYLISLIKNYNV